MALLFEFDNGDGNGLTFKPSNGNDNGVSALPLKGFKRLTILGACPTAKYVKHRLHDLPFHQKYL